MIAEFLLSLAFEVLVWFDSLLPSFDDVNGVVLTVGTFLIPLAAGLASLGVWIPWALITLCLTTLLTFYVGAAVLKFMLRTVAVFRGGAG